MKRLFEYKINTEYAGNTISNFLRAKGYSRHILTHLKRTEEGIKKNGTWAYTSEKLACEDILSVILSEETSSEQILPVKMELSIVYEDDDLLIMNKPADVPIHPSINNYDNTLANGLAYYFLEKGEAFVYRCINRLDRDTTGLLIIAKHMLSAAILSDMVKKREISREYLAVAAGEVPLSGVIDAPIGRKEGSVMERTIDWAHGETAITHYKRIDYIDGYSLVSLKLETGRTHQIRVHMQYLGHSLIGDYLYNPDYKLIKRQSLHSHRLQFAHPITGNSMEFISPLPEDMRVFDWRL